MERRGWRGGGRGRGRRQTIMQRRLAYIKKHDTKKKSNKQQYQSHTYDRSSPRTTLTTSTRSPSKIHPTGSQKSGVVVRPPPPPSPPASPPESRGERRGARASAAPRTHHVRPESSGRREGTGGRWSIWPCEPERCGGGVGSGSRRRTKGRGGRARACWRDVLEGRAGGASWSYRRGRDASRGKGRSRLKEVKT